VTNEERLSSARNALICSDITPDTPETDIIDLLANLLHLAREEGLSPEYLIGVALRHYLEEVND